MQNFSISSLNFKTLDLSIIENTYTPKSRSNFKESKKICPECDGTEFITDLNRGEIICQNCGVIIEERQIVAMLPRKFENYENKLQNDYLPEIYKRKNVKISDIKHCSNPTDIKRILRVDGYYNPKERRRNEIEKDLKKIQEIIGSREDIKSTAWNHYKNLEDVQILRGRRQTTVCATLMYIACLEQGFPIQLQTYSKRLSEKYDVITKSDIMKTKNYLKQKAMEIGYNLPMEGVVTPEKMLISDIKDLKEIGKKKSERDYIILHSETEKLIREIEREIRFYGSSSSFLPACLYYISKLHKISLTYEELSQTSFVSSATIRLKYRVLCGIKGAPKQIVKMEKKSQKIAIKILN